MLTWLSELFAYTIAWSFWVATVKTKTSSKN